MNIYAFGAEKHFGIDWLVDKIINMGNKPQRIFKNRIVSKALRIGVITLLALLMSRFVIFDLLTGIQSGLENKDFKMSDVYNRVCYSSEEFTALFQDQIVIVDVEECDIVEMGRLMDTIARHQPKAVGLDVFFKSAVTEDSTLIRSLSTMNNLVIACDADSTGLHSSYFFDSLKNANAGIVKSDASSLVSVVRTFTPSFTGDNCTYNHFVVELARLAAPESYNMFLKHMELTKEGPVTINYFVFDDEDRSLHKMIYDTISAAQLMEETDKSWLEDKIILVGGLTNGQDIFYTPVGRIMSGIEIHACSLLTILNESYISIVSEKVCWLLAVIICILFFVLNDIVSENFPKVSSLLMRIAQILLIFMMLIIGTLLFKKHVLYMNFAPSLLVISLAKLAEDILDGFIGLVKLIINK